MKENVMKALHIEPLQHLFEGLDLVNYSHSHFSHGIDTMHKHEMHSNWKTFENHLFIT